MADKNKTETGNGEEDIKLLDALRVRFETFSHYHKTGDWIEVTRQANDSHVITGRLGGVSLTQNNVVCWFDCFLDPNEKGQSVIQSNHGSYQEFGRYSEINVIPRSQEYIDRATGKKETHWGF